jgi:hypothetical protein
MKTDYELHSYCASPAIRPHDLELAGEEREECAAHLQGARRRTVRTQLKLVAETSAPFIELCRVKRSDKALRTRDWMFSVRVLVHSSKVCKQSTETVRWRRPTTASRTKGNCMRLWTDCRTSSYAARGGRVGRERDASACIRRH